MASHKSLSKIISVLITVGFVSTGCGFLETENDLIELKLSGKVKFIRDNNYYADEKFGEVEKGDLINSKHILFNENSNIEESNEYKYDGSLRARYIYIRDESNVLIERNKYSGEGSLIEKEKFDYNTYDDLLQVNTYNSEGDLLMYLGINYNDDRQKISQHCYDPQGGLLYREKFEYDPNGNNNEYYKYDPSDEIIRHYKSKYDDEGNMISRTSLNADGGTIWEYVFEYNEYDKKENWLIQTVYEGIKPVYLREREIEYY